MTHNKYLTFLSLEDNNPISVKSAAQILALNIAQIFLLLIFLIIGLCNCSASFSFTLTLHPTFLPKTLKTIRANAL